MRSDEEPCPWRILSFTGSGFGVGLGFGSLYRFGSGYKNAPKGLTNRFLGGLSLARRMSPVTASGFAMWSLNYAAADCTLAYIRKKEDTFNQIAAGGISAGIMNIRRGPAAITVGAITGATMMLLFEGVMLVFQNQMSQSVKTANTWSPNVDDYHGVEYSKS